MSVGLRKVKQIYLNNYVETYYTDLAFTAGTGNGIELIKAVKTRKLDEETFRKLSKNFYLDVIFNVWRTESTNKYGTLTDDQCYNEMKKDARKYFNFKFDTDTMLSLFQRAQSFLGLSKFIQAKNTFISYYESVMQGKTDLENVEDYKNLRKEKETFKRNRLQPSSGLSEAKKEELDKITSEIAKRRISVGPETPRKDTPREGKNILNYVYTAKSDFLDKITTGSKEECIKKLWGEVIAIRLFFSMGKYEPEEPYIHLMYALLFVYNAYVKRRDPIALPIVNFGFVWDKANKLYLINSISPDGVYLRRELNYITAKGLSEKNANLKATMSDASFTGRHKEHFYNTFIYDADREYIPPPQPVELPKPEPPKKQPAVFEPGAEDKKLDEKLKAGKITDINQLKKLQDYLERKIEEAEKQENESKQKYYEELLFKLNDTLMARIEDETRVNPTNPALPQKPVTPKRLPGEITPISERDAIINDEQHDIANLYKELKKIIQLGENVVKKKATVGDFNYEVRQFKAALRGNVENIKGQLPESRERFLLLDKYASLSAKIGVIEKRAREEKQPDESFVNKDIQNLFVETGQNSHKWDIPKTPVSKLRTPAKTPISISPSRPDTFLTPGSSPQISLARNLFANENLTMEQFYNKYLRPIFNDDFATFLERIQKANIKSGNYPRVMIANGVDQLWDKFLQIVWNTPSEKDQRAISDFKLGPGSLHAVTFSTLPQFMKSMDRVLRKPENERRLEFLKELHIAKKGMPVDFYKICASSGAVYDKLSNPRIYLLDEDVSKLPTTEYYMNPYNYKDGVPELKLELDEYDLNFRFEYIIEKQLPAPIRNRFIEIIEDDRANAKGQMQKYKYSYDVLNAPTQKIIEIYQKKGLPIKGPEYYNAMVPLELRLPPGSSSSSQATVQPEPPLLLIEYEPMIENNYERDLIAMEYEKEDENDPYIQGLQIIRADPQDLDQPAFQYEYVDETQGGQRRGPTITEEESFQWQVKKKYSNRVPPNTLRIWVVEGKFYLDIRLDK